MYVCRPTTQRKTKWKHQTKRQSDIIWFITYCEITWIPEGTKKQFDRAVDKCKITGHIFYASIRKDGRYFRAGIYVDKFTYLLKLLE